MLNNITYLVDNSLSDEQLSFGTTYDGQDGSGYGIYKSEHDFLWTSYTKTHDLIRVYDGWTTSIRYIDYGAFAYDLISAGFGSFNTVIMKK